LYFHDTINNIVKDLTDENMIRQIVKKIRYDEPNSANECADMVTPLLQNRYFQGNVRFIENHEGSYALKFFISKHHPEHQEIGGVVVKNKEVMNAWTGNNFMHTHKPLDIGTVGAGEGLSNA